MDSNDTPYLSYTEQGTVGINLSATVMKYIGGAWIPVGSAGFSTNQALWLSLALDSSGTPWVAYEDYGVGKAVVMKYYAVLPPAGFNKTAPTNAATEVNPNLRLSWGVSTEAASYEYCVDKILNDVCDTSWINAGVKTSVNPAGLKANTTYYWQVRAVNTGGTTYADAGAWRSFSTGNYRAYIPYLNR